MKLAQALETFGKDALKDIELPFTSVQKLSLLVSKGVADGPALYTAFSKLVEMAITIGTDAAVAVSDHGLNFADDEKILNDGKAIYAYVRETVMPTIEKSWADLFPPSSPVPEPKEAVKVPIVGIPTHLQ